MRLVDFKRAATSLPQGVTQDDAKELINITTERLRYIQTIEQVSLRKIASSETGAKMRWFSKEYNKSRKTDA